MKRFGGGENIYAIVNVEGIKGRWRGYGGCGGMGMWTWGEGYIWDRERERKRVNNFNFRASLTYTGLNGF